MAAPMRVTLVGVKALVCGAVLIAGCNGDRYGAYLHVTSGKTMDQIEFVFGGYMPSPMCDGSVTQHAPILRKTPGFANVPPADGDAMFRRQSSPGDVRKVSGTDYTLYVDQSINDPTTPFDDTLGHTLIVVAHAGPDTLVGELDNFTISSSEVDNYEIPLQSVDAAHFEQWGGGDERCLRYTRELPDNTTASEFIVPTWDRDCDGFFTQDCFTNDGNPIDNDCDPLAFCDVTAPGDAACSVPFGCADPVAAGTNDCRLADCQNLPGEPNKVCTNESSFCVDAAACNPLACQRPLPECLASQLDFDVQCDVSAIKSDTGKLEEGIACTNQPPGLLHLDVAPTVCTIVEQVSFSNTRGLGVTFSTPSEPMGCDLDVVASTTDMTGRLSEAGLIVNVASQSGDPGTLVVDVQPKFVDSCDEAQPPDCHPVDATPHACGL